jgi:hypothetical protein
VADDVQDSEAAQRRIALAASAGSRQLSLAGLGLESLPPSLQSLTELRVLDLSSNRLTQLPSWLGQLTTLETLLLRANRLVALPQSLAELVHLTRIDLADNRFVEIPRWLGRLDLKAIDVADNGSLLIPPPEIVAEGTAAVLAHLRERDARGGRSNPAAANEAAGAGPTAEMPGAGHRSAAGRRLRRAAPRVPASATRPRFRILGTVLVAVLLGAAVLTVVLRGSAGSAATAAPGPASSSDSPAPPASRTPAPTSPAPSNQPSAAGSATQLSPTGSPDATPSGAATSAAAVSARTGMITGFGGLCLDDANARAVNDNQIDLFTCNGSAAQQWTVVSADHTLQVLGRCLDTEAGGTANGTTIVLYDCNQAASQQFIPRADGSLYNPQSDKCLDDPRSSRSPRTVVQLWDCTGNGNQKWNLPG